MLAAADNVRQPGDFDFQPGFLAALAFCRFARIFVCIDETRWKAPQSLLRFIHPAHQQDFAILLDQHARGNFWIGKMDKSAIRAGSAVFAKDNAAFELTAALRAEPVEILAQRSAFLRKMKAAFTTM